jgi:acyl-CoA synthetase (NDP forming)
MLESVRADGREVLLETEAIQLLGALGISTPEYVEVAGPDAAVSLPGDRVVVKAMVPGLVHKSGAGAVKVATNTAAAISTAIGRMRNEFTTARSFLVAEYVEPDGGAFTEFLLGMRHTEAFGPIVTLGIGGSAVETTVSLAPSLAGVVMSPNLHSGVDTLPIDDIIGRLLLDDRFGSRPLTTRSSLTALLGGALDVAASLVPDPIAEFEVNPLVFVDGDPVALDAFARLGEPLSTDQRPALPDGALEFMLHPRSIGIVGVSERMNPGRVILGNVLATGFPPESITIVKAGMAEIDGIACTPSIEQMGSVDLLVVAVGADTAPDVVRGAIGKARSIVLIPGGIGEREGTVAVAEQLLADVAAAPEPRPIINGPNCMGIRSIPGRYDTTFIPVSKVAARGREGRHPVALVSASGAFVLSRHDRLPWLDPAYVITVGNQMDVTIGDHLDYLADDPSIQVVGCYAEGFRPGDGIRWAHAADRIRHRGGSVVLLLGGRTPAGADSAASHTAAVAGDARVATELARSVGVQVATTLEDFEDLLRLAVLLRNRPADGLGVGAVSNAGFEAVAVSDALGPLRLARLTDGSVDRIDTVLRGARLAGMVTARNPLDLTPSCGADAYVAAVSAILEDPGVHVGLVGCVPFTPALETLGVGDGHSEDVMRSHTLASQLVELWGATTKPWVVVVDGGSHYDVMSRLLEDAGIPVFRRSDRAMRALAAWAGVD